MVLSDEGDQNIEQRFQELCADLNIDESASMEAWQTFVKIGENFTLEGDALHWLACALYVACRSSNVPTVGGRPGSHVEGNCVSLTRLLRSSKLSLIHFFTKMKKWADMASLPQDFRNKVDRLERNFAVSTVIFKKFKPIYIEVFKEPLDYVPRARSRKQKRQPCTSSDLFSFCWTLFIQVKGNFPAISDDLVNSYHLLLSCVDFLFTNVYLAQRKDLLNLNFAGLPENFGTRECKPLPDGSLSELPCIIQALCDKHDGLCVEALGIKEHWWKPYLKKLFEKKVLKGKMDTLSGLLDQNNFEANNKAINNAYETYVLNVGDFDERIFLADNAHTEIGTLNKSCLNFENDLVEKIQAKHSLNDLTKSLTPQTPLTGRRYLAAKENGNVTPVSTATQSVSKLQTLLSGRRTCPSEKLLEIFKECSKDPTECIVNMVKQLGEKFCNYYVQRSDDHCGSHIDFARKRLQLGESLFYKVLEGMLELEKKRLPANFDFTPLLDNEMYIRSLLACCLEIVIFSYNSQRIFPWIIEVFEIAPYYFYKIIEVLIKAEVGLSRDVVKHFNHIEEQILESLAWKSESPLWAAISSSGQAVPPYEDVSLPNRVEQLPSTSQPQILSSLVPHPTVKRLAAIDQSSPKSPQQSPVAASLSERYTSPGASGTISNARRRLFQPTSVSVSVSRAVTTSTQSSQLANKTQGSETVLLAANGSTTTVLSPQKTLALVQSQADGGCIAYIPTQYVTLPIASAVIASAVCSGSPSGGKVTNNSTLTAKHKRTGSLALFFRKFYHLAGVRMQDLCDRLKITDEELRKKMWTCFENCIIEHTDLMKDRHLDQMIMCAVYVMAKVTQHDTRFQDIMRVYRMQPQAASHVYRSVLLLSKTRHDSGSSSEGSKRGPSESNSPVPIEKDEEKEKDEKRKLRLAIRSSSTLPVDHHSSSQPPTPTQLAGTSSSFEFEDLGDIITFYNQVYVPRMQKFVLKFSLATKGDRPDSPPLSPLPISRNNTMSPRRKVSAQHSLYISPLKSFPSPNRILSYSFNCSPAKNLEAINNMVRKGGDCKIGKRMFQDDGDTEIPAKKMCFAKRIQTVINERQGALGASIENTDGKI